MLSDVGSWLILNLNIEVLDLIGEMVGLLCRGVDHVFDAQVLERKKMGGVLCVAKIQEVFDDFWKEEDSA